MFVTKYKGNFVFATDSIQPGGRIRFKAYNVVDITVRVGENPPFVDFEPNKTKTIRSNEELTLFLWWAFMNLPSQETICLS